MKTKLVIAVKVSETDICLDGIVKRLFVYYTAQFNKIQFIFTFTHRFISVYTITILQNNISKKSQGL